MIHILNLFRNAGLICQMGYPNWNWMNMSIFEFGHSYASRFVSLFAMFLLALVLFEMLPQMQHVLRLLRPLICAKIKVIQELRRFFPPILSSVFSGIWCSQANSSRFSNPLRTFIVCNIDSFVSCISFECCKFCIVEY